MPRVPRGNYRAGQRPRAADVNAALAELRRQGNVRAEPPFTVHNGPGGLAIGHEGGLECWARITGGTNPYAWIEVIPQASGAWADATRSGTTSANQAREANGRNNVPAGTIVRLNLSPFGDSNWFAWGGCP